MTKQVFAILTKTFTNGTHSRWAFGRRGDALVAVNSKGKVIAFKSEKQLMQCLAKYQNGYGYQMEASVPLM